LISRKLRKIDYRVRLDFTYIPKNAYEMEAFFKIMLNCDEPKKVPLLNNELKKQKFWEKHKISGTSQIEVLRDMLDFASYIGILRKEFLLDLRGTPVYKLTKSGKKICQKFLKHDETVKNDLIYLLMNYKIPNDQLNIVDYVNYNKFQVRPYFMLLKVLYLFHKRWPNVSLNIKPKELGFIILSLKMEDDNLIKNVLENLYNLNENNKSLDELLKENNYNMQEFNKKTNNLITRLFRWAYYLELIKCETTHDEITGFFEKWNLIRGNKWYGIRIKKVFGLTQIGLSIFKQLENTYYLWERNLHPNEIIILEVLKKIKTSINKDEILKFLVSKKLCNKKRYERHLNRLETICLILENNKLKLEKIPIFDNIDYNILEFINEIVKEIKPKIKIEHIEKAESIDFTPKDIKQIFDYIKLKKIIQTSNLDKLANSGLERILMDYWDLSLGNEKLKPIYKDMDKNDIRQVFETKTAYIFKNLAFRVNLFGQSKRGKSLADIVLSWNRLNEKGFIDNHITIVECKSSKNPYNLSLKDVDDRVRQITNIANRQNYRDRISLIDSLLFVSSTYGTGKNKDKLQQIKTKIKNNLRIGF